MNDLIKEAIEAVDDINQLIREYVIYKSDFSKAMFDRVIDEMWKHELEASTNGDYVAIIYGIKYVLWQSEDDDRSIDDDTGDYAVPLKRHILNILFEHLVHSKIVINESIEAISDYTKKELTGSRPNAIIIDDPVSDTDQKP